MLFGNWPARPKEMRSNEIWPFGTKPNEMAFVNWPPGPNKICPFGTKPKKMAFDKLQARPKEIRPNEILSFVTKTN